MNPKAIAPAARPIFLASLALALLTCAAQAQLMVDLQLNKKNYVDHEPIMATITVKNIAGHDLIVSGPSGGGWLNLDIMQGSNPVGMRTDAPSLKPISLKANSSFSQQINLGRYYPLATPSNYGITASVYYPPLKRYFTSPRKVANVRRAKVLWNQTFGIPQGKNRPVQFRKYSVLSYRDRSTSELFVRVATKDDSKVFTTGSIGPVLRSYQPRVDVDSSTQLHVFHLYGPESYVHTIVDPDGRMAAPQEFYKTANGSRPELVPEAGRLVVRGGMKTDRNGGSTVPRATPLGSPITPVNRPRRANERPAGLPTR